VPNPLFDLITIYDDEDISKVSLVSPMQITKEKEPDRESTPVLDAPSQTRPQREHELESTLDVEPLDIPGAQMDIARDELGLGKQEEEIPQQEIDI
jgi:hypothetical protein